MSQQTSLPSAPTDSLIPPSIDVEQPFLTTEGPNLSVDELIEQDEELRRNVIPINVLTTTGPTPVQPVPSSVRFNNPLDAYYFILQDPDLCATLNHAFDTTSAINTIFRASCEFNELATRFRKRADEYQHLYRQQNFLITDQYRTLSANKTFRSATARLFPNLANWNPPNAYTTDSDDDHTDRKPNPRPRYPRNSNTPIYRGTPGREFQPRERRTSPTNNSPPGIPKLPRNDRRQNQRNDQGRNEPTRRSNPHELRRTGHDYDPRRSRGNPQNIRGKHRSNAPAATASTSSNVQSFPKITTPSTNSSSSTFPIREPHCTTCNKDGHFYVNCHHYQCPHCRLSAPNHIEDRCPALTIPERHLPIYMRNAMRLYQEKRDSSIELEY